MEITTTQLGQCDLVKAVGKIDSQTAPQAAEAFRAITDAGRFRIVFDMSEVEYLSSAGLRVLMDAQKTCKKRNGGELVLSGVSPEVYSEMDMVGFLPLFKITANTTEAVDSF